MKVIVEKSQHLNNSHPWVRIKVINNRGLTGCPATLYKHSYFQTMNIVGYYTKYINYKEKIFYEDYEEAWRFMWRKAMEWSE